MDTDLNDELKQYQRNYYPSIKIKKWFVFTDIVISWLTKEDFMLLTSNCFKFSKHKQSSCF